MSDQEMCLICGRVSNCRHKQQESYAEIAEQKALAYCDENTELRARLETAEALLTKVRSLKGMNTIQIKKLIKNYFEGGISE